jgi:hypothetical protein
MKKDRGSEEYRITNNVPIVYMAQDVMILMGANLLQGPLEGAGSENLFWATSTQRRKANKNLFTFLGGLTLPLNRLLRGKKD